jgi:tRNA (uracil-5-)-methyltransferase TRM9
MRVAMCSSGMDCVWNDELIAMEGENLSDAHSMISCGVFVSNSFENFSILCADNMMELYRYNPIMNSVTANRLLTINREFYNSFGDQFSATRQRLQPGVRKILETIQNDISVLDLGCGNGNFLRELARYGHSAPLLGVDFSLPLLRDAREASSLGVLFREVDLSHLAVISDQLLVTDNWSLITAFATLHHIPSTEMRLDILRTVRKFLKDDGEFILSNWQFLNSAKLRSRIQDWDKFGINENDLDEGDYLLDWRSGGEGLRYVHQFSVEELLGLADQARMRVTASFQSDGDGGNLGLYQVWSPIE